MARPLHLRQTAALCALLVIATLAVYWGAQECELTNLDDDVYVTQNPVVSAGLTRTGVAWSLKTTHAGNWHPLTWLSHMADCSVFGLDPMGHHLTSVLLHVANTLLLFLLLRAMTGFVWRSAFVAALFAVHPLHVESVAWVAERKDVLSGLFWIVTTWAYVRYARRPSNAGMLVTAALFGLGLMAKPMLVTLPLTLLLLDYWPLARFASDGGRAGKRRAPLWDLVWEKLPLFTMAAASVLITLTAQQKGGAITDFQEFPLSVRLANAVVSCAAYLVKTVWPARLAAYYPHPGAGLPASQVAASAILLLAITWLVVAARRRRPHLLVGWLWYVVTLIPVIGIVQVGGQAMADRYTYIPLVGVFLAIAWLAPSVVLPQVVRSDPPKRRLAADGLSRARVAPLVAVACVMIVALAARARIQVGYWCDSIALLEHAVACTSNNYLCENNLGLALTEAGRADEAVPHLERAIRIAPQSSVAEYNLGNALARLHEMEKAVVHYRRAVRLQPNHAMAHGNLAIALYALDDYAGAWREAHRCQDLGVAMPQRFLDLLSEKMPEPPGP